MLSEICSYFNKSYYVDILLFCERLLWRGVDYASNKDVEKRYYNNLMAIRDYLFKKTIKDGRIVLAISLLFMYKPLSNVKKIRLFRRYYDQQIECYRRIALLFNFLH